jgi:hypothetical protein
MCSNASSLFNKNWQSQVQSQHWDMFAGDAQHIAPGQLYFEHVLLTKHAATVIYAQLHCSFLMRQAGFEVADLLLYALHLPPSAG